MRGSYCSRTTIVEPERSGPRTVCSRPPGHFTVSESASVAVPRPKYSGITLCASGPTVVIGREECDLNFPSDVYMSGSHAKLEMAGEGTFTLSDQDSKNGTYLRIKSTYKLQHGDYLFLGRELLRVEMTA